MTIKSIIIRNFRSIDELKLDTKSIDKKNCSILLGKNESGKSNILNAISLLDKDRPYDYNTDCNKDAKKKNEKIGVIFELGYDKAWYEKEFSKKIPSELIYTTSIQKRIDINKAGRRDYFYVYLEENELFGKYVISKTNVLEKISDIYSGTEEINEGNIAILLPGYQLATKGEVEGLIEAEFESIFESNMPILIYWEHSSKYLINEPINLKIFKDDLSISIPLKNIFHIAGISDKEIRSRIEFAMENYEERAELSQILSEEITKYINRIWSEHKININVVIESDFNCIVNVEDKDYNRPKYTMGQRSDGFKQFISILLNLSAENKVSILKNKLILLDEPEVHLHPSGIKYLRDELLKISENNNLIIATHSTYMVDKINLNRHFSVSKDKSLTKISQIEENNPYEEEVIYESLGTSIFEFISPTMLIFEGKTDKDIFDAFSYKFRTELSSKNISAISANSVDNIPKYVKFFSGELVKGFVIVDSDKAGRDSLKLIRKENDNFNKTNTFEIKDLVSSTKNDMTLEDLFPKDIIEKVLLYEFNITIVLNEDNSFVSQIREAHKTIDDKKLKMGIANYVIADIKKSKAVIQKEYILYFEFISRLYDSIRS